MEYQSYYLWCALSALQIVYETSQLEITLTLLLAIQIERGKFSFVLTLYIWPIHLYSSLSSQLQRRQ